MYYSYGDHGVSHDMSQCLQWSPYNGISHTRSIVYDVGSAGILWLARWNDPQGNVLIGYMLKGSNWHTGYFKHMIKTALESPFTGCDLAIIADDCSVAWVRFSIGQLVPSDAAKAGYIIGHGPVLVARYNHPTKHTYRLGYYMTGNRFLNHLDDDSYNINTFDILVTV